MGDTASPATPHQDTPDIHGSRDGHASHLLRCFYRITRTHTHWFLWVRHAHLLTHMPIFTDAYRNPEPAHSFSSTFRCELPTQPHPHQHTRAHMLTSSHTQHTPAHILNQLALIGEVHQLTRSHTKQLPHTQNKGHTHTHTHTLWFTHLLTHPPKFTHTHPQSDEWAVVHTGPPTHQHRDAYTLVHTH